MKQKKKLTLAPFPSLRVNIVGVESFRFLQVLQHFPHVLDLALENRIARDVTEVGEFEMHRANFGEDAAPAARPAIILARLKISQWDIVSVSPRYYLSLTLALAFTRKFHFNLCSMVAVRFRVLFFLSFNDENHSIVIKKMKITQR